MQKYLFTLLIFSLVAQLHAQEKPNIIFIAVDDLKPTIGAYGDTFAITPKLDALASNGVVFLNNHTQQAICGPSRASLLTGKRPDHTKVWDLQTKMRDVNPDILTIPQYFKENGYKTIGLGKIYDPRCVDNGKDIPSWSIPYINENTFEYPDGYKNPELGFYQNKINLNKIYELKEEAKSKGVKDINQYVRDRFKPPYEIADVPDGAYNDGAIANKGIELLENMDTSKPFFLAIGFQRPHLPFVAPKKYWDLYDENKIELASYQKKSKNGPDVAYHASGEMQSYKTPEIEYKVNGEGLLELDTALQIKLIHGYYAATSYIDAQIGKIIEKLKQKGLDKNTIIVVWGDHGWHLGDHSLWNKHSNFEQATRSPLLIYDPRINKGIKVKMPTEFVDLFPTLCEMVGIEIPKKLDGISLNDQIKGLENTSKMYAVSQYPRGNKMGYSFRTENYRYTLWINNKKSTDPIREDDIIAEELYDYKTDPNETENKIGLQEYEKTKKFFQKEAVNYFNSQLNNEPLKKEVKKNSLQKNEWAEKRAENITSFIVTEMKLSAIQEKYLKETLLNKYTVNAVIRENKDLSQEEKQTGAKAIYAETQKKLLVQFSKEDVAAISKLERDKQKELSSKN